MEKGRRNETRMLTRNIVNTAKKEEAKNEQYQADEKISMTKGKNKKRELVKKHSKHKKKNKRQKRTRKMQKPE